MPCPLARTHQDAHALKPRSCESVVLHDQRDFADVIKVIDLEKKRFFWIILGDTKYLNPQQQGIFSNWNPTVWQKECEGEGVDTLVLV